MAHGVWRYERQHKMYKLGWFGVLGIIKSLEMSPFDRAHMISYSTLIETVYLIPFSSYSELLFLTYPTCISHPHRGRPCSNFTQTFASRKSESLGYRVILHLACDGQWQTDTHSHTHDNSIYRASIESHGKNTHLVVRMKFHKNIYFRFSYFKNWQHYAVCYKI